MVKETEYRLTIRISKQMRDEFQRICKENNLMGSRVLRSMIEKWIEQHKKI